MASPVGTTVTNRGRTIKGFCQIHRHWNCFFRPSVPRADPTCLSWRIILYPLNKKLQQQQKDGDGKGSGRLSSYPSRGHPQTFLDGFEAELLTVWKPCPSWRFSSMSSLFIDRLMGLILSAIILALLFL